MLIIATAIIIAAVVLMVRRVEVRLVLLGAGLAMALLGGQPLAIADTFTRAMVTSMVAPICASMGFAALMSATGCDRHLVHALLAPVRRARGLVVPGGGVGSGGPAWSMGPPPVGPAPPGRWGRCWCPCCWPAATRRWWPAPRWCWAHRSAAICSIPARRTCRP